MLHSIQLIRLLHVADKNEGWIASPARALESVDRLKSIDVRDANHVTFKKDMGEYAREVFARGELLYMCTRMPRRPEKCNT